LKASQLAGNTFKDIVDFKELREMQERYSAIASELRESNLAAMTASYNEVQAACDVIDKELEELPSDTNDPAFVEVQFVLLSAILVTIKKIQTLVIKNPEFFLGIFATFIGGLLLKLTLAAISLEAPDQIIVEIEREVETVCSQIAVKFYRIKSFSAPVRREPFGGGKIRFYAEENQVFCQVDRVGQWMLVQKLNPDAPSADIVMGWISVRHLSPIK